MKKRFTDTDKWDKQWFRKLPPKLKCLWAYLVDRCDQAGVWEADFELASFYINEPVAESDLLYFGNRIVKFSGNKYRIVKFINFQNGKLSASCRAHVPIIKLLDKHGLSEEHLHDDSDPAEFEPIRPVKPLDRPDKEKLFEEMFGDELFMSDLTRMYKGLDFAACFDACYLYHSNTPHPPNQLYLWKQKMQTWCEIQSKKNQNATTKKRQSKNDRTSELLRGLQSRLDEPDEGGSI